MKKIIIAIVILIIILIGVYMFTSKSKLNVPPTDNSQTQIQTPTTTTNTVDSTQNVKPADVLVDISNFNFNPSTLNIKVGTKVTWTNNDTVPHTVTSVTGKLLDSPKLSLGQSFSFVFDNPMTVDYKCSIHPMMKGKIVVSK